MNRENEIKELIAPMSRTIQSILKEEIRTSANLIYEKEAIKSVAVSSKGLIYYLVLLTSERLLVISKQGKVVDEYFLDEIKHYNK